MVAIELLYSYLSPWSTFWAAKYSDILSLYCRSMVAIVWLYSYLSSDNIAWAANHSACLSLYGGYCVAIVLLLCRYTVIFLQGVQPGLPDMGLPPSCRDNLVQEDGQQPGQTRPSP